MPVHTYTVEGMTCQNCVRKVEEALESIEQVRSVEVDLDDERVTVETNSEPEFQKLRDAVANKGNYSLSRLGEADRSPEDAQARGTDDSEESLYPLILIVSYIAGTVLLIALATGDWAAMSLMRHFMAGFFIVFSFFKLLDLRGFVGTYRTYDLVAKASPQWGWAYPFVELALGVLYLLAVVPIATNVITLVLMLIGAAGVLKALLDKQRIRCACLGTALNLPMTKVTLVEDLTMAAMAAGMLVMYATG